MINMVDTIGIEVIKRNILNAGLFDAAQRKIWDARKSLDACTRGDGVTFAADIAEARVFINEAEALFNAMERDE